MCTQDYWQSILPNKHRVISLFDEVSLATLIPPKQIAWTSSLWDVGTYGCTKMEKCSKMNGFDDSEGRNWLDLYFPFPIVCVFVYTFLLLYIYIYDYHSTVLSEEASCSKQHACVLHLLLHARCVVLFGKEPNNCWLFFFFL